MDLKHQQVSLTTPSTYFHRLKNVNKMANLLFKRLNVSFTSLVQWLSLCLKSFPTSASHLIAFSTVFLPNQQDQTLMAANANRLVSSFVATTPVNAGRLLLRDGPWPTAVDVLGGGTSALGH